MLVLPLPGAPHNKMAGVPINAASRFGAPAGSPCKANERSINEVRETRARSTPARSVACLCRRTLVSRGNVGQWKRRTYFCGLEKRRCRVIFAGSCKPTVRPCTFCFVSPSYTLRSNDVIRMSSNPRSRTYDIKSHSPIFDLGN
jgi:hypothetical protein